MHKKQVTNVLQINKSLFNKTEKILRDNLHVLKKKITGCLTDQCTAPTS